MKVDEATKNEIAGSVGLNLNMPNYLRQQNENNNRPSNEQNRGGTNSNFKPFAGQGTKLGGEAAV